MRRQEQGPGGMFFYIRALHPGRAVFARQIQVNLIFIVGAARLPGLTGGQDLLGIAHIRKNRRSFDTKPR